MTTLIWGELSNRVYETGVDRGVLYVDVNPGVPWDGLISVDKVASAGATIRDYYLDGDKILSLSKDTDCKLKLTAYSSPPEFDLCDGMAFLRNGLFATMQPRKPFGLSYRTLVGNGTDGDDFGYKIHLVYNAMAVPNDQTFKSASDKPSLTNFTWDLSTTPVVVPGATKTAHLVIDTTKAYDWAITALENILYGTDVEDPRLPLPDEVIQLFEDNSILQITDNGDGTFTADGPDSVVSIFSTYAAFTVTATDGLFTPASGTTATDTGGDGMFTVTSPTLRESTVVSGIFMNEDLDEFQINWPTAIPIDTDSFYVSSL
jgi:hypothetical protein